MSNAARKIKQLRSEALALAQAGEQRRALEKLTALEALEPSEPDWPHRAAECHRQLGQRTEQLAALSRAASNYVGAGMVVKAMAICKMMLALDPKHPAALSWMGKLEVPLGVQRIAAVAPPLASVERRRLPAGAPRAEQIIPDEAKAPGGRDVQQLSPAGREAQPASPAKRDAQQLLTQRGLVAVARELARRTGRNAKVNVEVRVAEVPTPAPTPPRASHSSGNWQVVDDAELLEADAPRPLSIVPVLDVPVLDVSPHPVVDGVTRSAPSPSSSSSESQQPPSARDAAPASISLPPLSMDTELRRLVPGSTSVLEARGRPSGMFRLPIDEPPPTREEQAVKQAKQVLPAVPLFSELDPATLEGLIRQSKLLHFEPGDAVVRQDDAPDCLYVVVNGSVALVDESAADIELYRLGENEFFGEAALVSNELWTTTVRAVEPCDLMAFDRDAMRACIANNPAVVPVLLRFLRARMVEQLVRTSPLFVQFPTTERRALTRKFEFIEIEDNAVLVQQGAPALGLFVLLSGAVDVTHADGERERWLATLERGGIFGEMSLLRGTEAMASVRAVSPGFALMLPASAFRDAIVTHPPLRDVLTRMSEERGASNLRR